MIFEGRRHHDMGGDPAGPIDREPHAYADWERRVDAMMMLLSQRKAPLLRVDEMRQNIETMGPARYDGLAYYEKWMHAMTQLLVKRGIITLPEVAGRMEEK